jgi:hypothetical protein
LEGHLADQFDKAPCYKAEGHGFDLRWRNCIFPSSLWPWVDSVGIRNGYQEFCWGKGSLARQADKHTTTSEPVS